MAVMSDKTPLMQPCKGLVGAAISSLSEGKNNLDFALVEICQLATVAASLPASLLGSHSLWLSAPVD